MAFDFSERRIGRRAWVVGTAAVLVSPRVGVAAPDRRVVRYERAVPGASIKAGAARAGVQAPRATVQEVVTDYAGYARFIRQFERARVVRRTAEATDLFLEIPIFHGLTKIWAVLRFHPPVRQGAESVIQGRMIKGNVERLEVTWRLHQHEEQWTDLAAELLLDIDLPVPRSAVLKTVKRAAAQAVKGARDEAELARARQQPKSR